MTPLWLQLVVGVGVPISVALIGYFGIKHGRQNVAIHDIVNSRMDAALRKIGRLEAALRLTEEVTPSVHGSEVLVGDTPEADLPATHDPAEPKPGS